MDGEELTPDPAEGADSSRSASSSTVESAEPPTPDDAAPDWVPSALPGTELTADGEPVTEAGMFEDLDRDRIQTWIGWAVVIACGLGVLWIVNPGMGLFDAGLVFDDTTPTGGDMGSHVWGPAFLRDHLLTSLRVSGWTPDWYAGFPAYSFYMVVPSLAIVALDVGILPWWMFPLVGVGAGYAIFWVTRRLESRVLQVLTVAGIGLAAVLLLNVPYNVGFKMVAVSGVVTLPGAVWFLGRSLGLKFGGPELMAIMTVPFLADQTLFHIYGGNIASTMAGEFAFSISLTFCILFLGVVARGLQTGKYAAWGIAFFALTALNHVIPMFIAVGGAVALWLLSLIGNLSWRPLGWVTKVGVLGGLIAAFWYVPFYMYSTYMNDMGWEKLGLLKDANGIKHVNATEFLRYLRPFAPHTLDSGAEVMDPNMFQGQLWFVLAAVGAVLSIVLVVRAGIFLSMMAVGCAAAFYLMPQTRFWNARVLPFYYFAIYLLAAVGIYLVLRAVVMVIRGRWSSPPVWASSAAIGALGLFVFISWGMAFGAVGSQVTRDDGTAARSFLGIEQEYTAAARGWAQWNFEGLEGKGDAWVEFSGMLDEMNRIGDENGCGRAMWEYENEFLQRYGTPMAPMMIPYFTDGCIGSQEGLYFEASSTTPFHFIMQDELSQKCSCAQRFDHFGIEPSPYGGFDLDSGIEHMQMLGIRYYMAFTDASKQAAAADPRLTRVGGSGPWEVYEVDDADLVVGLDTEPAVWGDVDDDIHQWAPPAVAWFTDPEEWDVQRASDGPEEWQRISAAKPEGLTGDVARWVNHQVAVFVASQGENIGPVGRLKTGEQPDVRSIDPAIVSDIEVTEDSISFEVDEPGKPVLVRTSYFPHWKASGAEGPYRVAPNQMVVIPTDTTVELSYGRGIWEWIGWFLTAIGLVGLFYVIWRGDPTDWPNYVFVGDRDDAPPPPPAPPGIEVTAAGGVTVNDDQLTLDLDATARSDGPGTDGHASGGDDSGDGVAEGDGTDDRADPPAP